MESASMTCTRAGWASTAILVISCALAPALVHAEEVKPAEPPPPALEPGQQPPDPPVLPEPEIVTPPEAPPILFPVTVEWSILDPDPAVSDDLRFVAVYCGTSADPYKFGRFDFAQPGTRGVINLPAPAQCMAVAYYFHDGAYRYSEPSAAVLVDPLKPAAPELVLPVGMETSALRCATGTQRCQTNSLQTKTSTRPAVRTRSCICILE